MPPLYDNIADAFELAADGTVHTLSLSNIAATFETNETSFAEPQEGVWAKVDLSGYPVGMNPLIFDLVRTGGDPAFSPEFAVFRVIDASFDPTSPDFSKLGYVATDTYVGDGSTDPGEQTIHLTGGTGSIAGGDDSINGIFYLAFNDWNYAVYGDGGIDYSVHRAVFPPNDDIINATYIPVGGGTISGTTFGSTTEPGESPTRAVWYRWKDPGGSLTARITLLTEGDGNDLFVYESTVGDGATYSDLGAQVASVTSPPVASDDWSTSGIWYYIAVQPNLLTDGSDFSFSLGLLNEADSTPAASFCRRSLAGGTPATTLARPSRSVNKFTLAWAPTAACGSTCSSTMSARTP